MIEAAPLDPGRYHLIPLDRRGIARQEIRAAIDLFIVQRQPIAANVLAWAAIDMLRGVAEQKGVSTFHDHWRDHIKDEHLRAFWSFIKRFYNFSKHADHDPSQTLDGFSEEACEGAIFWAVHDYAKIYGNMTMPMKMFLGWFFARYPGLIRNDAHLLVTDLEAAFEDVTGILEADLTCLWEKLVAFYRHEAKFVASGILGETEQPSC